MALYLFQCEFVFLLLDGTQGNSYILDRKEDEIIWN